MEPCDRLATCDTAAALQQLIAAKQRVIDRECERFVSIGDAESLHDLRVAMRRLHSLFAGFPHCFRKAHPAPGTLHALFRETNHARDLEVSLAWLHREPLALPWLAAQWQQQLEEEYRRLRQTLPPRWLALSPNLADPKPLLYSPLPAATFGGYAATRATAQERQLLKRLSRLHKRWDDKRAHKLRIRGKRLRYLLEPFAEEHPAAARAVAQLKGFQDKLGDYHDVMVLRQRLRRLLHDPRPDHSSAIQRARQQLKQEQRRQRTAIRSHYLAKMAGKLPRLLSAARRELAQE
jgi:CHAD domain-containing protein